MITTNVKKLRDPFVLVEDDAYYMYGSEWKLYKNTSNSLDGEWVLVDKQIVVPPADFDGCDWAPEVHKYKGKYYMFTTYKSKKSGLRGCSTFVANSPEGPFIEHSNGFFTPLNQSSIDATLYIDEYGQPWTVYVHEHCSLDDKIGRMDVCKMTDDLSALVGEPKEIFRADSPSFSVMNVTDGCYVYRTKTGKLLMVWSNYITLYDYAVLLCESDNGKIDGNWIQKDAPIFSKEISGTFDGGHSMIFTDRDGTEYISLHSPNYTVGDRKETPVFLKIEDLGDSIKLIFD